MLSQHIELQETKKSNDYDSATPFEIMYQSIIKKDFGPIRQLIDSGIPLIIQQGIHTPCSLVAMEKNHEAVNWLLDIVSKARIPGGEYNQINQAMYGYAIAGEDDKVDDLRNKGGNIDYALEGYGIAGRHEKVDEFIGYGTHAFLATRGYSIRGDDEYVNKMIIDQSPALQEKLARIRCAIEGHAFRGDTIKVNELLEKVDADGFVFSGYLAGGHFKEFEKRLKQSYPNSSDSAFGMCFNYGYYSHPEPMLRLLSHIEDAKIRIDLAHYPRIEMKRSLPFDVEEVLHRAKEINYLMNRFQLNFNQAYIASLPSIREKLVVLGSQLAGNEILPIELVSQIVANLSTSPRISVTAEEVRDIYDKIGFALNKKFLLNDLSTHSAWMNLFGSNYTRAQALQTTCKGINTKKEMNKTLNNETKDGFYEDVLVKHHNRFKA